MKINTLYFGELQVEEADIISFTQGLPGFEDLHQFTLLQPEDSAPFSYFQSLQEGELTFLVVDPFLFFRDYDLTLSEGLQQELKIERAEDVQIWTVVTVNEDLTKITANLLAPIVRNVQSQLARQIILHDSEYTVKHEIVLHEETEATQVEG